MTNYINWMQTNQPSKDGVLQMEGNPVAAFETPATTVASAVAPQGALYASVWADVATKVKATNLKGALVSNVEYALPANTVLQIPNVQVSLTQITMTDV